MMEFAYSVNRQTGDIELSQEFTEIWRDTIKGDIDKADKAFGHKLSFGYRGIEGIRWMCAQEEIGEDGEGRGKGGAFMENGIGSFDKNGINNKKSPHDTLSFVKKMHSKAVITLRFQVNSTIDPHPN